jgi:hypothetical protein
MAKKAMIKSAVKRIARATTKENNGRIPKDSFCASVQRAIDKKVNLEKEGCVCIICINTSTMCTLTFLYSY